VKSIYVVALVLGAATITAGIILINLGFLGAAVWVVVKTLQHLGVI
jgi:hypothetical protein